MAEMTTRNERDGFIAAIDREAEVAEALAGVGLPPTATLDDLIRHHRANAALAAEFDRVAEEGPNG